MVRRPLWPFSVAPPVQALRGLPCLRSFSVVRSVGHIEAPLAGILLCRLVHQALKGAPWVGPCSVVQWVRRLMGQALYYYSTACAGGVWEERSYGDGSTPYSRLSRTALLPWLPSFPPLEFPTTNSSLTSPWYVSPQSTAALTLGFLHNP